MLTLATIEVMMLDVCMSGIFPADLIEDHSKKEMQKYQIPWKEFSRLDLRLVATKAVASDNCGRIREVVFKGMKNKDD